MAVATVDYDGSENFCIFSDPGIKLFGRDIPLKQEPSEEPSTISTVQLSSYQDDQADSLPHIKDCKQPMEIITCGAESTSCVEIGNISGGSSSGEASLKCGISTHDTVHTKEDVQDLVMIEKTPKKPDKLLPCPRCNSLDTKFCYFNNYNVNQPRHFCRKCQRYWTAGGTLRNVPVGAGRRKNKHSTFHQKHSMVSDAVRTTSTADMAKHRFGSTGSALCSFSKPTLHVIPLDAQALPTLDSPSKNSTILTFGQESPLCRSMAATTLGMQEAAVLQTHGGVHAEGAMPSGGLPSVGLIPEQEDCALTVMIPPPSCQSNGPISSSPSLAVNMQEGQHTSNADSGSRRVQLGDIASPGVHVAAWQPGNNGMSKNLCNSSVPPPDAKNSAISSLSPLPPSIVACNGAPGSFWPGFSWSFMHPALWGASPLEWAGPWNVPVYPPEAAAAAAAAAASFFPPYIEGSPPQKQQVVERSQPEKCLWVPKTLRIDDPLDAARSSIWTTLGLGDGPLSSPARGPTNAFQTKPGSKDDNENVAVSANRLSNPAALSRSAAFQENS